MHNVYESPFSTRYASKEMSHLFSAEFKFQTWRKLWIALAKGEKSLGLPITDAQIHAMENSKLNIEAAEKYEKTFRHDVMAHIHAFGDECPIAKEIIHLGATSCFVTDNTDLIQMREGLYILKSKLLQLIRQLADFALKQSNVACLGYTHFQTAQPTTVGKRACLWLQDFVLDFHDIETKTIRFLGLKGATGTQASFLSLFNNNPEKVKQLDAFVAQELNFSHVFTISGQTYTRKQDVQILSLLNGLAVSSHKFATDLRLLAHLKELEEPFKSTQVGSSAMPHKRNPMQAERICGLSRFLISLCENPSYTAATQWLERTLDDSSNRRLVIPEAFLCADSILNLLLSITANIQVHPDTIARHLQEELPSISLENILMAATKKGKDRQAVHEHLRTHTPKPNDPALGLSEQELHTLLQPNTGRAKEQVDEFLKEEVFPLLEKYKTVKPSLHSVEL